MNRLTALLVIMMMTSISYAQRTIPLNIEQLVRDAGMIVDGKVLKTETGKDPQSGLLVTWVTVGVNENFYGVKGNQFTFKQYGGEENGVSNYLAHLPRYSVGDRAVLFLTGPSTIGMQSPVGMQQGVFELVQEKGESNRIKNVVKNPSLFRGLSSGSQLMKNVSTYNEADGSLEYDEFAKLIRSFVQQIKQ